MNLQQMVQLVGRDPRYIPDYITHHDPRVLAAMMRVDRKEFLPEGISEEAYVVDDFLMENVDFLFRGAGWELIDGNRQQKPYTSEEIETAMGLGLMISTLKTTAQVPVLEIAYHLRTPSIGYNQTCSDPSMVATMCTLLELQPGNKVLEIGTGCGYHAAVTAEVVGPEGTVYSVERIPQLAEFARGNLRRHFGEDHGKERVVVIHGDGSCGLPDKTLFDRIYFTAGVDPQRFDAQVFCKQLRSEGILLFPEAEGSLIIMYKNSVDAMEEYGRRGRVRFVPLMEGRAEL